MEDLLVVTGIFTFPLSIVFGVAWWNARKELQLRREIARELGVPPLPREISMRPPAASDTQRLEDAIEAIALEVERLADGQRFVAKLLAERPAVERARERPSASPALPPAVTPH